VCAAAQEARLWRSIRAGPWGISSAWIVQYKGLTPSILASTRRSESTISTMTSPGRMLSQWALKMTSSGCWLKWTPQSHPMQRSPGNASSAEPTNSALTRVPGGGSTGKSCRMIGVTFPSRTVTLANAPLVPAAWAKSV
jgi:hypothetical protein